MPEDVDGTTSRGAAGGDTFGALLNRLKRRGTSVLVVGDLSPDLERAMSRRMMGHPSEERYRLLALLKPTSDPAAWFPGDCDPDDRWVEVVERCGLTRDAAAVEGSDAGPSRAPDRLSGALEEWADSVAGQAAPDPGELRVGVASLDALEDGSGLSAVTDLASSVHDLMRSHGGLAHLYYPRARDSDAVQRLSVWVDVVVEVRTRGGRPEQRWVLQEELETSWFPLREDAPHRRTD